MIKNLNLASKLILFILVSTAAVFGIAFGYYYYFSKKTVLKNVEENAKHLTYSAIYKIEAVLQGVEKVPRNQASMLERRGFKRDDLFQFAQTAVMNNPEIFGSAIAFEPYAFSPRSLYFAPYSSRERGEILRTSLGSSAYPYFFMDWYQIPKELSRPIWSEPYYDEGGGGIVMSTFSVPFYQANEGRRRFWGIVTADVSLKWLKDVVSSIKIYQHGYAFLISRNGVFVTHPQQGLIMRESLFSLAEARNDDSLRRVGKEMIRGNEGFVPIKDFVSGRSSWLYYASLPSNGWALGVIFPEDELFADIRHLGQTVLLIGVAGFLFLGFFVALISGTITHPLRSLAQTTSEIARGNLDIDLPEVPRNDEVGRLTRSFKEMKIALKEYISHLAETTAAKERIESELKIARTIQMSFLPKRFPPFPGKKSFEIYAALEPAKEVGGDLYDFFLVGEDRLFFTIGDVSGKGVPAALFMAVTKTLLKGLAETGMTPSEVLTQVNLELSKENDSMMFVTVFCGLLDLRTGELFYSNAGHVRPLMIREGNAPDWLSLPPGIVLGAMEEASYQTERVVLQPGDRLFSYTDGVTEAINAEQAFFSNESLLETVRSSASCSCNELVKAVMEAVKSFAGGMPQFDDIAILALCYKGEKSES